MADWTNVPDTSLEPGAPAKGRDMRFLRDNPIAIAEGAPGAPRVTNAALDGGITDNKLSTSATNTGRDWVLARNALSMVGVVGTYAMLGALVPSGASALSPGDTLPGSSLRYASVESASGSPSGTWRLMGRCQSTIGTVGPANISTWLRIS